MPRIWIIVSVIGATLLGSVTTGLIISSRLSQKEKISNNNVNVDNTINQNKNTAPPLENSNIANTNVQIANTNQAPVNTTISPKPKPKPTPKPVVNVNTKPAVDPAIKIELCKTEAQKAKNDLTLQANQAIENQLLQNGMKKTQAEILAEYTDPSSALYIDNPYARQQAASTHYANQQAAAELFRQKTLTVLQIGIDIKYNETYQACLNR